MTAQQLREKLLNLNLANENIATVLLDLGNFESLITIVCSQREALEKIIKEHQCVRRLGCPSCTAKHALADTDQKLKSMGVL